MLWESSISLPFQNRGRKTRSTLPLCPLPHLIVSRPPLHRSGQAQSVGCARRQCAPPLPTPLSSPPPAVTGGTKLSPVCGGPPSRSPPLSPLLGAPAHPPGPGCVGWPVGRVVPDPLSPLPVSLLTCSPGTPPRHRPSLRVVSRRLGLRLVLGPAAPYALLRVATGSQPANDPPLCVAPSTLTPP